MRRTAVEVDEARVEELVGQLAGHMTGRGDLPGDLAR